MTGHRSMLLGALLLAGASAGGVRAAGSGSSSSSGDARTPGAISLPLAVVPVLEIPLDGAIVDVVIDHEGRILLLEADTPEIRVLDGKGRQVDRWSLSGFTEPAFLRPEAVALTGLGLLVLDPGERLVLRFDLRGEYEGRVVDLDIADDPDGRRFFEPADFAMDGAGRTFLTDRDGHRVVVFDAYGEPRGSFGGFGEGLGQLREPTDVAVDASGQVWVVDAGNRRLQRFDNFGTPLAEVRLPGDPSPVPVTVAPLPEGRLAVIDDRGDLHLLSGKGRPLGRAHVGDVRRVAADHEGTLTLLVRGTEPRLRIVHVEPSSGDPAPGSER